MSVALWNLRRPAQVVWTSKEYLSGYAFMVLRRIELKLGRVIGGRPQGLWSTFRGDPMEGQRSYRGQSTLKCPSANKRPSPYDRFYCLLGENRSRKQYGARLGSSKVN